MHSQALIDAFQDAKMSRCNVQLLGLLQERMDRDPKFKGVIDQDIAKCFGRPPASLLNQANFLGHAYMCLVWLPEIVKTEGKVEGAETVVRNLELRLDFLKCVEKIGGPRDISDVREKLRLIRNGLAHNRVEVECQHFLISDQQRRDEKTPTTVRLRWEALGQLSDAYLLAVSDLLYNTPR